MNKAAHLLDLEVRRTPVDGEWRSDPAAIEAAIDEQTILIYASAPCYPYGVIDRMQELVAESGELEENLCVAAHLAHVVFAGRTSGTGEVVPRYKITLASQIDEQTCRRVNLDYLDYRKCKREDYENDPDTLIVERAGRDLYLAEPQ